MTTIMVTWRRRGRSRTLFVALMELDEALHGRQTVQVAGAQAVGELPDSLDALRETEWEAIAEQLHLHHTLTATAGGGREISALRERLLAVHDAIEAGDHAAYAAAIAALRVARQRNS